ncbi:MAG: geranylgeranyl reductase family protein [Acidimicrobiia bacterium]|nr:geranylgeranyl reductase family protein [Acidimicrobiia bacterium]
MAFPPITEQSDEWACDVIVVGAGPAGCATAIEATRAGCKVVVVDKSRFPRDKCCGDGLTTGALRHLDALGLDPVAVPSWKTIDSVHLRGPRGRRLAFPLPPESDGTFAAVCRRSELDAALVDLVRREGATVLERHELVAVSQTADSVTADVAGIRFHARYLVAADGMWSPTRKLLGIGPPDYRGEWHAFRQYFTDVTGPAADQLLVWFEPDLLPGYAWSFPLAGGTANVGFGIQRGRGHRVQDMKNLWPRLLGRDHVVEALGPSAKPEAPHRAWPIPARLGDVPLAVGRALFVGDAAAATDPMTGEGIGQAIETGRDAARSIATAGFDVPERAAAQYRRCLEQGMIRDHGLARSLSTFLRGSRRTELAISVAGASEWTRRHFARWLFEDYPRAAVVTPSRWHRRLFTSPGAFHPNRPPVS